MSTQDPIKQDELPTSMTADESAETREEDVKRELADDEVGSINAGGNIHNPPPTPPLPTTTP